MLSRCLRWLALLGLLVLAGCSGAGSSSSSSPPSPTAASSPTPVPSPTLVPSPTPLGPVPPAPPGVYLGTDDSSLIALNLSDGTQRWKDPNASTYNSLVALDHNVIYISLSQSVAAFNASDGVKRWQTRLDDPVGADDGALLVANGVVYVGTDQFLYALNASDGALRWKSPQPVGPAMALAISGSTLYLNNGNVLALSASDGSKLWDFSSEIPAPGPGRHLSALALADGVVYTGEAGRTDGPAYIFAVDASTGKERWHSQPGSTDQSPQPVDVVGLAVDGSKLYVSETNDTASVLYALDSSTGSALWRFPLPGGARYATAPVTANGIVYVGATEQSGVIYAVNAQTGTQRWGFVASAAPALSALVVRPLSGGPLVFAPLVFNGMVYIRAGSQVYALTANAGQKQWVAAPGSASFDEWAIG